MYLINYLKILYRVLLSIFGFYYHLKRYIFLSGISLDHTDNSIRNYDAIRIAHSLEKSMSMPNRKKNSGWLDAKKLFDLLNHSNPKKLDDLEILSLLTLKKYINYKENKKNKNYFIFNKFLERFKKVENTQYESGIKIKNKNFFNLGKIKNNEAFFKSRYSIRNFSNIKINKNLIDKAVKLAIKTPSVCNRQSWHIHHSSNKKIISNVLKFQSGNRGFGNLIPNLVIVTTDLKSFLTGKEFYQQWIDGGMFSMSFIYALHSMGLATCPLNWSQDPITDRKIRKIIDIKENQSIIMMIAIGNYLKKTPVCISGKKESKKFWSEIKIKKID